MLSHNEIIYREAILDLYRNPLNKKKITNPSIAYHEFNPSCGDEIEIALEIDDKSQIVDIGHQGQGCAISQAAVSLLTDEVKGKTINEALEFTDEQMFDLLQIPITYTRRKCATLGLMALRGALHSFHT